MKQPFYLIGILLITLFTACSDDEDIAARIQLSNNSNATISFTADGANSANITFSSTKAWTATSSAAWLSVSPKAGTAGDQCSVTVTTTGANTSATQRTGTISLASDGKTLVSVTVTQTASKVGDNPSAATGTAEFEKEVYVLPVDGADSYTIMFSSDVDTHYLGVARSSGADWVRFTAEKDDDTRATAQDLGFHIWVDPNPEVYPRSCTLYVIQYFSEDDDDYEPIATCEVVQTGTHGTSSASTSGDGQVITLQTHTVGNGLSLVVMGDGFLDTDLSSGWYSQALNQAVENFFTEEPIKSLRDYFDVYQVNVISQNNIFADGYQTAFSSELERNMSTLITGDDDKVLDYCKKVSGIDAYSAQALVVLNTTYYAGTTSFGFKNPNTKEVCEFAVAYCPVVDGLESESFRQLTAHEAVGHGFAKLEDEYSYESQGALPASEKKTILYLQDLGWAQNVDFTTDRTAVLWHEFLADSRYSSEGLGIIEGGATYMTGIYRPTEDSMMRTNTVNFNAPCRRAIYNRVLREGTGAEPTYEEFVQFDKAHPYQASAKARTKAVSHEGIERFRRPLARPRVRM